MTSYRLGLAIRFFFEGVRRRLMLVVLVLVRDLKVQCSCCSRYECTRKRRLVYLLYPRSRDYSSPRKRSTVALQETRLADEAS